MGKIFGLQFGKPRRRGRKKRTRSDKYLDKAEAALLSKVDKNPALEAAFLSKHLGIELKPGDLKSEKGQTFKDKVQEMAIEEIENDPVLKKRAVEMEVENMLGEYSEGGPGYGGEYGQGFYPGEDLEDQIERVERIKALLGADSGGALSFLKHPDVAQSLIGF